MVTKNDQAAIDLDKLEAVHRTAKACGVFAQIHPDTALELIDIARQAAPEAPTLPETTSERIRIIANSGDKALIDDVAIGRISIKEAAEQILIRPSSTGAAPEAPASEQQARDWIEDTPHENGNYQCKCSTCGHTFIGHKRRVTCKSCAATTASASSETLDTPLLRTHLERIRHCAPSDFSSAKAAFLSFLGSELGRATAPSRNADDLLAELVSTKAALELSDSCLVRATNEAAELRAALTQQSAALDAAEKKEQK